VVPQFGVDEARFHPPAPARGPGPLAIGYAGRLVWAKGVDLLLAAVAGLAPPWRLDVVGDGPERARLLAQAQALGLGERVTFTPWLPSAEMPDFLRRLDLLVLPSRSTASWVEQFGRVLIEAMASGVVCLGSDSGEIPHVLGAAGWVFPENDALALRAQIECLAGAPAARAALATAGRARALAHFSMARVAADTVAAYRSILGVPGTADTG
jgi:glycosyltransferase involved in cell wall biosynthesis